MISIAREELPLDPEVKTAIIYSVAEITTFIVELHYQTDSYFMYDADNHPMQFANLALAKAAAAHAGATQGYQALENIYQEVGAPTHIQGSDHTHHRYEYVPFDFN